MTDATAVQLRILLDANHNKTARSACATSVSVRSFFHAVP